MGSNRKNAAKFVSRPLVGWLVPSEKHFERTCFSCRKIFYTDSVVVEITHKDERKTIGHICRDCLANPTRLRTLDIVESPSLADYVERITEVEKAKPEPKHNEKVERLIAERVAQFEEEMRKVKL